MEGYKDECNGRLEGMYGVIYFQNILSITTSWDWVLSPPSEDTTDGAKFVEADCGVFWDSTLRDTVDCLGKCNGGSTIGRNIGVMSRWSNFTMFSNVFLAGWGAAGDNSFCLCYKKWFKSSTERRRCSSSDTCGIGIRHGMIFTVSVIRLRYVLGM